MHNGLDCFCFFYISLGRGRRGNVYGYELKTVHMCVHIMCVCVYVGEEEKEKHVDFIRF